MKVEFLINDHTKKTSLAHFQYIRVVLIHFLEQQQHLTLIYIRLQHKIVIRLSRTLCATLKYLMYHVSVLIFLSLGVQWREI